MCGIAGFLGRWDEAALRGMGARLAHRGPDGEGYCWQLVGADSMAMGLAHRRLSIIDLSDAASQPMVVGGGRYTLVFNGEIYNYKEISDKLIKKGYDFNVNSDTAVLAPLYDAYGADMLDMLEGMFAFAIWDRHEQELFVARDGLGIKPFYFARTENGFAFASEMKALAGVVNLNNGVDAAALREYLTFLWTPGEKVLVPEVKKLRPGHWMKVRTEGGYVRVEEQRWYRAPMAPVLAGRPVYDEQKTPEMLRQLLLDVVREQCVSDVPVGAFLSGGVDSSAVVAMMCAAGVRPAMTYCVGFEGEGMQAEGFGDDLAYARMVAEKLDVPLTEVRVGAREILDGLPALAGMLDEPQADPAPLLVQAISRRSRADGIKVLMSGTGGDDVFSGYRRHMAVRLREKYGWLRPLAWAGKRYVKCIEGAGAGGRRLSRLAPLLASGDEAFLLDAFMTNTGGDALPLFDEATQRGMGDWSNALTGARAENAGQELLNRLLDMELHGFLPDHNLNYTDKAAMVCGVEVRVPLIDRRVLAWMADVPPQKKMHGTHLKAFFKDSMRHDIPPEVIERSKAGFGAPVRSWLASEGRELVEATLFERHRLVDWGLDERAVRRLWHNTMAGRVDGTYRILALCMVGWWLDSAKAF